jgi:hypothetical protein
MVVNKCCWCIPLKHGVIIISILWLVSVFNLVLCTFLMLFFNNKVLRNFLYKIKKLAGAYQTIRGILTLLLPNNYGIFPIRILQILRAFIITTVVLYALVTIGAAFGLIVVSCAVCIITMLFYLKTFHQTNFIIFYLEYT